MDNADLYPADPFRYFRGDGSEPCVACGLRDPSRSLYVGRRGFVTDDGLLERTPVCCRRHGFLTMARHAQLRLL